MTRGPWSSLAFRRFVFGAYAGVLFVMTHWPRVAIPADGRWDLLVHACVFGGWAAFLLSTGAFGTSRGPRNIARSLPVAMIYACVDEGLQAIPAVKRVAAWDDLAANISGILIVSLIAWRLRIEEAA